MTVRSGAPARGKGISLRALIVGAAAVLVLSTCLMLAGLLLLTSRMRASLDREARVLIAEQETAAAISREVGRQLVDAANYLNDLSADALERFRARGQRIYTLERGYLFRDLSIPERLQVERVKELHQTLEVRAQAAFDVRGRGNSPQAEALADTMYAAADPVLGALDGFLAMRAADYQRSHARQLALLRSLYVAATVVIGALLAAILLALRFVQRRIVAPVDALAQAAERVGAGDLSVQVPARAHDELGRLSRSFNAMTSGLAALQGELRTSEERYRGLVELTPDAVIVHDAEQIRLANPEAVRLFGAGSEGELVGRRLPDLLHPDAPASAADRVQATVAGGERGEPVALPFQRLDGGTVYGELVAAPLDYEGHAASLVVVRDVTARREAEAALRETEDRLRQAQKMEAVGRLAGGIAHDFNNLLTVILSNGELALAEMAADDPARPDVEEMRDAGKRAAALTRQLLAFSRKQVLQPGRLDLNEVVEELTTLLRRLIPSDIELRTELAPGVAAVEGDRGQLEQVILNLALNARDAMPNGGRLTVATALVPAEGARAGDVSDAGSARGLVSLSVADTGVGMDDATRARIFEPFFTTKEPGRGTGLGLATVYGIVRQSGGQIRVQSEPGRGSRFEILLPALAPSELGGMAVGADPGSEPARGVETVLLAEDDPEVRALALRVLERQGYTVIEARDGATAERAAAAHDGRIDLLVTDVVMPGIGGRELARRLVGARPGLRVLFTSGYTEDEILRRGVLEQTFQLLDKPYSPWSLLTRVREVLDGSR